MNNKLLFASEIKPIINSGLIEKKVNARILYRYLRFRVHDNERETFFQGVERLLPGEMLTFEKGKMKIEKYSKMDSRFRGNDMGSGNDKVLNFRKKLEEAIKLRLISDVPVGTCLSGGLDSSTVVAVVNKLLQEKDKEAKSIGKYQNTYSAVFPGSVNDEEKYVDALTEKLEDIHVHKVLPKPEEFFADLEDFVRTQEEPTISTGPYAQYQVMREAKKSVKVLLDGQGADEMMAGYLPYYFVYLRQLKKQGKWLKLIWESLSSLDVIVKYVALKLNLIIKPFNHLNMMSKKFKTQFRDEKFETINDNLKERLIQDIFENSLQSLLRYEDRNSMRFSIEGRVPFLDKDLLATIFSMPDEAIIKNGWNKRILRDAVKDLLPGIIVKRRNKIGFTTPENEWFLRMKNRIYSIFLSESFANRPYFDQQEVVRMFQKFIEGKTDDSMAFWRVLNTEMWLREFFDKNSQVQSAKRKVQKEIDVDRKTYQRNLIKTDVFQKNDDFVTKITNYVLSSKFNVSQEWFVVVSEKIIAIAQGRSYFIWDIKPGVWAKFLQKFVTRTPYGIGLGSPWTMQLAIQEVGLPRIMTAALISAITKPFGIKGVFYRIAGWQAAAIDGPTEYSLYPSNVSAKLAPKNPDLVARQIKERIEDELKNNKRSMFYVPGFRGVVVLDANDLGRNVLGNSTNIDDEIIE
ncbi:MAG: asparagine synthase-related protein, partial [Patescibacteria group bacterium]